MFAYLFQKWMTWCKPATARKQAPARRRLIPRLEVLEGRWVPTVAIADFPALTGGSSPLGITAVSNGNVWFTENQADKIGMINPTTHAIQEFQIPTASSGPEGITVGPDGNLWFTEYAADQIGVINPTTHAIHEFQIPTASSGPQGITAGPDGNLWFTEYNAGRIGTINPTTHSIGDGPIPTANSGPLGITAGPDGNIWFTEQGSNKIGEISPTQQTFNEYPIPQGNSQPYGITAGSNGNLWFTENAGNSIGEINTSNQAFSDFSVPTASSGPQGITAGPDGNIWFTETTANQIGEVNLATAVVTETSLPTASATPAEIVAGPGGSGLWFTESSSNKIGEVVASTITTAPVNQTIKFGQTATFTAAAAGFPTPTVDWQVSTNGGATFTGLTNGGVYSGVHSDTLSITGATQAMNGYEYWAVFTNGVGPTAITPTTSATLTVKSALSITPALPQGIAGTSYSQTLSVLASTTPFSVFTVNNFLPGTTGLTPSDITPNPGNGTIVINGTPGAAGTATFTVTIANTGGDSLTQKLVITIRPPLSIATSSLPVGNAGVSYNQAITVVGGVLPYAAFTVTNFDAGTTGLKAGEITAHPATGDFKINGTPSGEGTATFTVNVTDSAGTVVTKDFTITLNPPLLITPSLPAGTAGTAYNQTLSVTGGGEPYTSLAVKNFSAGTTGLTIANVTVDTAAATVTVAGTPTAAGTVTFLVKVVDANGAVLNQTYSVTINPSLSITSSLPQGTALASYDRTITVAGGSKPYTDLTVTGFNVGTTSLSTTAITIHRLAGTVVINGTPGTAGTVVFTVNVTDAAGSQLTKDFSITINAAPTIGNLTTTQWTAGKSGFTGVFPIAGGTGPFILASSSGFPTGMTVVLSGNEILFTGTPSVAQTFAAGSITIRDAAGASATKTFSITINPAPAFGNLTATQWTAGLSGFAGAMTVSGGTGGLSIASSSGLPTGLTAVLTGNTIRFTGTPTAAATFAGSITLRDAVGAEVAKTFTITINAPPTLSTLTRSQWTTGISNFTGVIPIAGGTGPFTLAGSSGLPTGLTAVLIGNEIHFTGTPSVAQKSTAVSITIHDATGASVTKTFSITINPPLLITTTSLPATTMGVLYTATVLTKGGTGADTFALTAGSLPPGMKLSSTGVITGVSRGLGSFSVTITATDAVGATFSEKYTLSVS